MILMIIGSIIIFSIIFICCRIRDSFIRVLRNKKRPLTLAFIFFRKKIRIIFSREIFIFRNNIMTRFSRFIYFRIILKRLLIFLSQSYLSLKRAGAIIGIFFNFFIMILIISLIIKIIIFIKV
jgi:hypothetical protein